MKLLYLSGPMSGLPELNFPAFYREAERLRRAGYAVVNPADLGKPGATWRECMRADIKALVDCQGVALMPGWSESKGAKLEAQIGAGLGLALWGVDQWIADAERAAA